MYQYSEAKLRQEIADYIRSGCYPFCRRAAFADKVDRELAYAIFDLEGINKANGRPFLCVDYDKIVARRYSGLNRRYYNASLIRQAFAAWGSRSLKYLHEAGVLNPKDKSFRGRGMYIKNMEMLGKDVSGCYVGSGSASVLFYYAARSPAHSVMNFYHEAGHNLQDLLKMKFWRGKDEYSLYRCEVHAEVFASAMMILNAKTERERRDAEAFVMEKAVNNADFSGNVDVKYNSYAVVKKLIPELRKMDRQSFEKIGGRIDMVKTAIFAQRMVDRYAYLPLDFERYAKFEERYARVYPFSYEKTRWYKDCTEAREKRIYDKKAELENILLRLQKARSEQEKAAVFEDDYLYCGEDVKEFRQLYLRYNKRGRYYAMLKRTEMFLKPENIWKKAKQMISFLQKRNLYRGRAR